MFNWDIFKLSQMFEKMWPGPLVLKIGWLFPMGESLHFIGLCLLFGSLFIIDLRLMGYFRNISVRAALSLLPFAIIGFLINLASGWLMFTSAPLTYLENPAFFWKMGLIVIAGLNAAAFTLWEHRRVSTIGPGEDTPGLAKFLAGTSLLTWLVVLLLGRMLPIFTVGTN